MFTLIKRIFSSWKKFTTKVSEIQATVFFTLFYLILMFPIGLVFRVSSDVFRIKKKYPTQWVKRKAKNLSLKDLKSQF